jgi:hypothetical protein
MSKESPETTPSISTNWPPLGRKRYPVPQIQTRCRAPQGTDDPIHGFGRWPRRRRPQADRPRPCRAADAGTRYRARNFQPLSPLGARWRRGKASRFRAISSPISCPEPAPFRSPFPRSPDRRPGAPSGARSLPYGCSEQIVSRALPLLYVNARQFWSKPGRCLAREPLERGLQLGVERQPVDALLRRAPEHGFAGMRGEHEKGPAYLRHRFALGGIALGLV